MDKFLLVPRVPTCADVLRQHDIGGPGSLVSMLIEVQPDGSQLLLKGDDRVYQEMIKRLELVKLKRLSLGIRELLMKALNKVQGMSSPYGRWFI